jgi:glycosyltransferase involved in cell wall biosynthesis
MRILALMEALSVTGPAKNLLNFCQWTNSKGGAPAGLSITLATTSRSPDTRGDANGFVQAARKAGLPIEVMAERYRFDREVIPQLKEVVRRVKPDLIQTHNVKPHFLVKAAGLHRTVPWIAFHHGYTWTTLTMEAYNQLDRWSLPSARCVVTVCEAFEPQLRGRGVKPRAIRVLHNSVVPPARASEEDLAALRSKLGLKREARVLLTVGRFSKEKGYADLVDALALMDKTKDWKAILVGDGPERPNVEALSRRHGLEDRVIFAGFHLNTAPFFELAELFVLPSHSEGSPNVILEAMAAGVPIVATAVGGTPEVVSNEQTALLVPSRRPQAMAAAISRLLGDDALQERFRHAAAERALVSFSPETYRKTLLDIYSEVAKD